MWSELEKVFKEIEEESGIPFSRQGSYEIDETLPDEFFTFWNVDAEYTKYYDNEPRICEWTWNIFYYTNKPETLYSGLDIFGRVALKHGFLVRGKGKDLVSDEPNYQGRYCTIKYIECL